MIAATYNARAGRWQVVNAEHHSGRALVLEHVPAARHGTFCNPRALFERRAAAVRVVAAW